MSYYLLSALYAPNPIIIFVYNNDFDLSEADNADIEVQEELFKDLFLKRTNLQEPDLEIIKERINVCVNSDMFKIENSKFKFTNFRKIIKVNEPTSLENKQTGLIYRKSQ